MKKGNHVKMPRDRYTQKNQRLPVAKRPKMFRTWGGGK